MSSAQEDRADGWQRDVAQRNATVADLARQVRDLTDARDQLAAENDDLRARLEAARQSVTVEVTGLPALAGFMAATAGLLRELAPIADSLPETVIDALDELRQQIAKAGGRDIGPPPERPAP